MTKVNSAAAQLEGLTTLIEDPGGAVSNTGTRLLEGLLLSHERLTQGSEFNRAREAGRILGNVEVVGLGIVYGTRGLSAASSFEWKGGELVSAGGNARISLFGNMKGQNWFERVPHYHLRVPNPLTPGESYANQGIKRHRPWQTMQGDQFLDRFGIFYELMNRLGLR